MAQYDTYLSPYTWRYGSQSMRQVWSEANKRRLWRKIWVALAEAQETFGLVSPAQVEDLRAHSETIDVERALVIEAEIHHDLMAELLTFAEQAPVGGPILHMGATSMDIEDNADALRIRDALDQVLEKWRTLLAGLADQIERWADLPVIAFTHLQPAEPSTLGYRLAFTAQDLLYDYTQLNEIRNTIRGKGFKGAVGTGAAYMELVGAENFDRFEGLLSLSLDLPFFPVASQTYPRRQDYSVVSALAGAAASLSKFALDLRFLQSPPVGEVAEPFSLKQVGSSAMPFKRNPIRSEKINSLARLIAQLPRVAWDNAANSILERTLDDSANRRAYLPEAFLILDEIISTLDTVIRGLQVDEESIARNLSMYGGFAATERILMALTKAGADRQKMHARLREHALKAWDTIHQTEKNLLHRLILEDKDFLVYIPAERLEDYLQIDQYLGVAPARARAMALRIRQSILIG